jgi:hypothetical protein
VNCAIALDLMLEADLSDLQGLGDSALSHHVRECAGCRAAAQRILETERALQLALAAAEPHRSAAAAMARAARRRPAPRWLRRALPLAAAAGLAAVMLLRRQPTLDGVVPRPPATPALAVTAPPGRNVAVLQTDNPDVVVYWFF